MLNHSTISESVRSPQLPRSASQNRTRWYVCVCGLFLSLLAIWSQIFARPFSTVLPPLPGPNSVISGTVDQPSIDLTRGQGEANIYLRTGEAVTLILGNPELATTARTIAVELRKLKTVPVPRQQTEIPLSRTHPHFVVGKSSNTAAASGRLPSAPASPMSANDRPPAERLFWIHVTGDALENKQAYQPVTGELVCVSPRVQIYLDQSIHLESREGRQLCHTAESIAATLEESVLQTIESEIGEVSDVDGDGRLTILMTPWLGRLRGGQTQVSGFVRSSDFEATQSRPFSNRADLLYLNSQLPGGPALNALLLHELTHAALFSRLTKSRLGGLRSWDDWLNEGVAHLVERASGNTTNIDHRVARYWQQPSRSPLIVTDYYRAGRWRDHGCRGATFLFWNWCEQEYARHHSGTFLQALLASGETDYRAAERVLGRSFPDLFREWTIDLARVANQPSAPTHWGRYPCSGPRREFLKAPDDPTEHVSAKWQIPGTAAHFLRLTVEHDGWYRLAINSDPFVAWQATLLRESAALSHRIVVTPERGTRPSNPDSATAGTVTPRIVPPLAPGWRVTDIKVVSASNETQVCWNWRESQSPLTQNDTNPGWKGALQSIPWQAFPELNQKWVIQARIAGPARETAWIWGDGGVGVDGPAIAAEHLLPRHLILK